jgi:hypothetical protein
MSTETDSILDMLDSIEDAIAQQPVWSGELAAPAETTSLAPAEGHANDPHAPDGPFAIEDERVDGPALGVTFRGRPPPSDARKHPDPPPRSMATVTRVRGTTAEVLARFRWGER